MDYSSYSTKRNPLKCIDSNNFSGFKVELKESRQGEVVFEFQVPFRRIENRLPFSHEKLL